MTELERVAKIRELQREVETIMLRVSAATVEAFGLGAYFTFEHQTIGDHNYLQFVVKIDDTPAWAVRPLPEPGTPEEARAKIEAIFANGTRH